ncbi:hypothetical protein [Microbacterium hydrocarbonoxydans]|uniref:hypothetical protein n=1 Tax=Microbacterium hydrocarbonoxydans TaxID=273678 RepID=UPI00204095DD|nr:hypothetical protein [Microbacterium hydrocarbonoxydans]MCM3778408.1 hypothetical protein [Microbacterium hydrocarbonoxydans]
MATPRFDVLEPSANLAASTDQELAEAHRSERDADDDQVSDRCEHQEHGDIISDGRIEPQVGPFDAQREAASLEWKDGCSSRPPKQSFGAGGATLSVLLLT